MTAGQAEVALFDHFNIIVRKTDQPAAERQRHTGEQAHGGGKRFGQQSRIEHRLAKDQRRRKDDDCAENEHQTAHGGGALFVFVPGGTDIEDSLSEFQFMQQRQQFASDEHRYEEG